MPALLDAPTQLQLPATSGWGSLYPVEEQPVKPGARLLPVPAKKPAAYGGRKKNLETCTEALGCETGGVDVICDGGVVEAEYCAERKRRSREEQEDETVTEATRACRVRGPLPPPLTTLARGASRVRMVHERRGGRLEVFAVRSPGTMEAERGGGRLRLRILPFLSGDGNDDEATECRRHEPEAKEEAKEAEEEYGLATYVRGGLRCVDVEVGAAAAAMPGKQWEPEQAAAFWVATS